MDSVVGNWSQQGQTQIGLTTTEPPATLAGGFFMRPATTVASTMCPLPPPAQPGPPRPRKQGRHHSTMTKFRVLLNLELTADDNSRMVRTETKSSTHPTPAQLAEMETQMDLATIKTGAAGQQELVDALHQTHRTTQAMVAETMLKALAQWAEESHQRRLTDLRNGRAVLKVRVHLQPIDPDAADQRRYEGGDLSHLNMYTC